MRILLSGQKYFGAEVLRLLLEKGFDAAHVAAPKETEKGTPDRLWTLAEHYGVPLSEAKNLNASTLPTGIDLIVCAHSHAFISEKTRLKTTYGAIGYHPSLLPLHRGRDAIKWAIKMGDKVTGGTVFWLSNKVDGGAIAAQDYCFIHRDDTPESLWRKKLLPMGLALLEKVINDIQNGLLVKVPQDESLATFEPAMNPPRLFRPDLIMLGDGKKERIRTQVERKFKEAFDLYSPERVFEATTTN
jgi:methionyl-tRNA formyltransferase